MALGDYLTGTNIGYGAGILAIILIAWWLMSRRKSGREGLDIQEEGLTNRLKRDETLVEITQEDEKTQCGIMQKAIYDIGSRLVATKRFDIHNQINSVFIGISDILRDLRDEKMNLPTALNTFKTLDEYVRQVISQLPNDDDVINRLVEILQAHKSSYYRDLIKEIKLDGDKDILARTLLTLITSEERGTVKAA